MKKNLFIALSVLFCMSAFTFVLTACGDDEPITPTTMTQEFIVKGEFTSQDGNFINGEPSLNDPNTKEYKFYKAIYDEVVAIIKAQVWEITYKSSEKNEKLKEQNEIASQRFTAMVKALDAVQQKLNAADKDTYKCHFSMTIELKAMGEKEIRSGQKTLSYAGNE